LRGIATGNVNREALIFLEALPNQSFMKLIGGSDTGLRAAPGRRILSRYVLDCEDMRRAVPALEGDLLESMLLTIGRDVFEEAPGRGPYMSVAEHDTTGMSDRIDQEVVNLARALRFHHSMELLETRFDFVNLDQRPPE
jgi:hypothetical protein